MIPRPLRPAAAALLTSWLAGACSVVDLEAEPLAIHDLRTTLPASEGTPVPLALAVAEPAALQPLASERIATRSEEGALGVLSGARWAASGTRMVQEQLLRAFEGDGRLRAVSRAGEGIERDCVLASDLRAFEYEQATGRVRTALQARLVCGPERRLVASRAFAAEAGVTGSGAPAVVAAFEGASADLVAAVVRWALDVAPAPDP
ncbi:MAG: ABC-type transport auxiliary lipoprotein family protein [Pseudomonadales bacterium]|jgi:cholesterol transport system auxiliary component|nr:ABC-type transport auxiliary lipoprotein family protein [Pseudomonadales bacterium]